MPQNSIAVGAVQAADAQGIPLSEGTSIPVRTAQPSSSSQPSQLGQSIQITHVESPQAANNTPASQLAPQDTIPQATMPLSENVSPFTKASTGKPAVEYVPFTQPLPITLQPVVTNVSGSNNPAPTAPTAVPVNDTVQVPSVPAPQPVAPSPVATRLVSAPMPQQPQPAPVAVSATVPIQTVQPQSGPEPVTSPFQQLTPTPEEATPQPAVAPLIRAIQPMPREAHDIEPAPPVFQAAAPSMPFSTPAFDAPALGSTPPPIEEPQPPVQAQTSVTGEVKIYSHNTRAVWKARRSAKFLYVFVLCGFIVIVIALAMYWRSIGAPTHLQDLPLVKS